MTNDRCRYVVDGEHIDLVTDINICTSGNLTPDQDEGTALVDYNSRTLIGMSTFIFNNDATLYVDIYLRIEPFVDWIEDTIDCCNSCQATDPHE